LEKTVVLGLSGGLDSFVSALLLKKEGFKVIACTFKLWNNEDSIDKARLLAKQLDIEFRVVDLSGIFKERIVEPFIRDYMGGITPSPCIWCNREIKIYYLHREMQNLKADYFATGHYVRLKKMGNTHFIYKGIDTVKDQSYFLWNINAKYLQHWLTPLGKYTKQEVKQIAIDHKMGFLASAKESMGVCFLGSQPYYQFLEKYQPSHKKIEQGYILDLEGNRIGTHKGIPYYTIGQKKGLDLEDRQKVVSRIDAKNNTLTVAYDTDLEKDRFFIRNYYFVNEKDMEASCIKVWVRGIGRNPQGYCSINKINNKELTVQLSKNDKAWALANGQVVAFYIKDRLIGGGYIFNC